MIRTLEKYSKVFSLETLSTNVEYSPDKNIIKMMDIIFYINCGKKHKIGP